MRSYLLPIVQFRDKNYLVVNRKRFMPEALAAYEGTVSFFGGEGEGDETPEQALTRELNEELPGLRFLFTHLYSHGDKYHFYTSCSQITLEEVRLLVTSCEEGLVDFLPQNELDKIPWSTPELYQVAVEAFNYWKEV